MPTRPGAGRDVYINSSDRIVVKLLSPPDMPQMIMIRWPQHSTIVAPTRFPSNASEIARLFARAGTELTQGTPTLTPTSRIQSHCAAAIPATCTSGEEVGRLSADWRTAKFVRSGE
jgi:hypothetical protein